jgi:hypothetical protein
MRVSGQRHAPAALYALGKDPPLPIVQEDGWAPESVWTQTRGKILSPLPVIEPGSPGRPTPSQTLYCPSYPAHALSSLYEEILVRALSISGGS